jgi:hypothetical protein
MAHVVVFSVLMIVAIVVTVVLFVLWIVLTLVRFVGRLFLGPGLKPSQAVAQRDPPYTRRCDQGGCKAMNPVEARFCRRCGRRMDDPQRVPVRRAAML